VGPRASLGEVKSKFLTLPGLELRPLGLPARSQSLNRLCHPDSSFVCCRTCLNIIYKSYRIQEDREMSELQGESEVSQSRQRVKFGHESSGTRNQ
jgi:hypothetical protein